MNVPTKALAVLGVLLQSLILLNFLGFNGLLIVYSEEAVFFVGCFVLLYGFLAALTHLRMWIQGRQMRAYAAWLHRGGDKK